MPLLLSLLVLLPLVVLLLLLLLLLQAPGAWAHAPLQERLAELKVPITFIYGEHDWMQPAAGQALADKLDQIRPRKVGGFCQQMCFKCYMVAWCYAA